MKTLKPIKIDPKDFENLEKQILQLFREEIYLPLLKDLRPGTKLIQNSKNDLLIAIQSGIISFSRGKFTGTFTGKTSRALRDMGAKWENGKFLLSSSKIPEELKQQILIAESRFEEALKLVDKKLSQVSSSDVAKKTGFQRFFEKTIFKVDKAVKDSMAGIVVGPDLTPEGRKRIAEEYAQNLEKYVVDFVDEEVLSLRKKIQKRTFSGLRYEGMVKEIQKSYGVSQNKAKFLARQETNLIMAKFKAIRYEDAGVNEYIWRTVSGTKDHPVRPMHRALDGKTFRWDNPPVTSDKGDRNNPGEDYNCRCYAVPVVKFE